MYKALYRKYRPKNFDDIVGQEQTVKILKNSIKNKKIAHAYLFHGPRGTGKTSLAKIFSNEVNGYINYTKDSVDIIEIDAASNNGVDEIRDIKENIKFLPTEGKYKIYIVDEVHMLTTAAFNALLKTLEEPPSHVIFILATTEMHKIPPTILSRCQKFEFKNLTIKELEQRIIYVASEENIDIEDKAVTKIAVLSKGGLRDAIGILDQAANYTDNKVTLDSILEITSSISEETVLKFYKLLLEKNIAESISEYNRFLENGKDTKLLLIDLINISKDILIFKNLKKLNFCDYDLRSIENNISNTNTDSIYKIISILSETEKNIRFSTEYISYMQVAIINICSIEENFKNDNYSTTENTKMSDLINKIQELENKINKLESNYVNNTNKKEQHEISDVIIPKKKDIINIINNNAEQFFSYTSIVFKNLLKKYSISNIELYNIIKEGVLEVSSKEGCIITIDNLSSIKQYTASVGLKRTFEQDFIKATNKKYNINVLQKKQYNYILENIENENKNIKLQENEIEEKIEKKSLNKIEDLFSDIIEEE